MEQQQRRPPPRFHRAPGIAAPYGGGSTAPTAVEEQPTVLLPPRATLVPAPLPDLISTSPCIMWKKNWRCYNFSKKRNFMSRTMATHELCYCFHTGFVQLVNLVLLLFSAKQYPWRCAE